MKRIMILKEKGSKFIRSMDPSNQQKKTQVGLFFFFLLTFLLFLALAVPQLGLVCMMQKMMMKLMKMKNEKFGAN